MTDGQVSRTSVLFRRTPSPPTIRHTSLASNHLVNRDEHTNTSSSKRERQAGGASRRKQVPRSNHAHLNAQNTDRSALVILHHTATDRVPHLLQIKYDRMAESPFGYFRGAVPVMAHDLGHQPHTGILNQLCGDAHVRNLGAYAALDGSLTFDINDFDESLRGPFEWDVKRLATSIYLAAREVHESERGCRDAVRIFTRRYRKSIHHFADMPVIELGRYQVHRHADLSALSDVFAKAERSTPTHLRDSLTEPARPKGQKATNRGAGKKTAEKTSAAGDRIFCSDPPLLQRLSGSEAGDVLASLEAYRQTIEPERCHLLSRYRPVDVAFKVVGTGSVGLRDYCIYFEGNGTNDPLFLQIKQEVASAWALYLKDETGHPTPPSEGARAVNGQRAMQIQSDPFLGYTRIGSRDYLVRQLNDHKGSVDLADIEAETLLHYADLCGELLARGHARSGDPDALSGYIGHSSQFDKAIADFARSYADQTEKDWDELHRSRKG